MWITCQCLWLLIGMAETLATSWGAEDINATYTIEHALDEKTWVIRLRRI